MTQVNVEVPEELLRLLGRSRLAKRDRGRQICVALAIHLLLVGEVSLGKAAELAGEPRATFEDLLLELGLPLVQYDASDYQDDLRTIEALEQRKKSA
jgi:predicted HTH domain antitoxin